MHCCTRPVCGPSWPIQWLICPLFLVTGQLILNTKTQRKTLLHYRSQRRSREGGGAAGGGQMKNDPVDGIMQRNDFSSTIICLVWIAAAVATLHLVVCRTKKKKKTITNGGAGRESGLKGIRREFLCRTLMEAAPTNLCFGEWLGFSAREEKKKWVGSHSILKHHYNSAW